MDEREYVGLMASFAEPSLVESMLSDLEASVHAHEHPPVRSYPGGVFAPNSTSVMGASDKTHDSIVTVTERLYRNNSNRKKQVKTANDALLSSLPTDSLRWIKKRRKINSFEKVALTHFRERQLRDIFQGLDFDGMGTIHLDLVVGAANYAEEKLRPKKGKPVFTNIQGMFTAMDEDGDGTVDFHEFTVAMTGSSKSTMDNATEQDVEKLTKRFIEYANIRRRERAVEEVNFTLAQARAQEKARPPTPRDLRTGLPLLTDTQPDYDRYQQFRTLFSIGAHVSDGETVETIHGIVERAQKLMQAANNREKAPKERLLDGFYDEMARIHTEEVNELERDGQVPAAAVEARLIREKEVDEVQKAVRERRLKTDEDIHRDPEAREMYERIREEKRYLAEMKKCPWLPPVTASAVTGKPTLVPQLQSPAKRQVHAKLRAMAEFIDVRPRSPETRNGIKLAKKNPGAKSAGSLCLDPERERALLASKSARQIIAPISTANLRYNYSADNPNS